MLASIRGFNDVYKPEDIARINWLESRLVALARGFGYQEIRLPLMESSDLFQRSIGTTSDIVHKEMYTFVDKNDQSISLRPEGTASCARACMQHHLLYEEERRFFYLSPMFRRERPQKGRLRQFHQFGVEFLGASGPEPDLEQLQLLDGIWKKLNVNASLKLNYLGNSETRARHRVALQTYYQRYSQEFSPLEKQRLEQNPLRLLDSKSENIIAINQDAPQLASFYLEAEQRELALITDTLEKLSIPYTHEHNLVRGLDYYTGLVYEWVSSDLGAQASVCGGGRYDGLTEQIFGQKHAATGFSIGMERLLSLVPTSTYPNSPWQTVFWIGMKDAALAASIELSQKIREHCKHTHMVAFHNQERLKPLLRRASKHGLTYVVIYGSSEAASSTVTLKNLHDGTQELITLDSLIRTLQHKENS